MPSVPANRDVTGKGSEAGWRHLPGVPDSRDLQQGIGMCQACRQFSPNNWQIIGSQAMHVADNGCDWTVLWTQPVSKHADGLQVIKRQLIGRHGMHVPDRRAVTRNMF